MAFTPPGKTRARVFEYVRERLLAGEPPTVREVQAAMGFRAVQTARQHLEALVTEGKLVAGDGRSRGYRLASGPEESASWVPLLGQVHAGPLHEAVEDLEGYVPFQGGDPAGELFALRVEGESMIDVGILPGDLAIVRRQSEARSGQIVVALVNGEATVKTLRIRRNRVELHPANPDFEPIVPDPGEVEILGRVVEVRRRLAS